MARERRVYICSACNASFPQWKGQCPTCGEWNSLLEQQKKEDKRKIFSIHNTVVATALSTEFVEDAHTLSTTLPALDSLFGKGIVTGSSILLGGEPGIGKSTLVLQLAEYIAKQGQVVLYASGEESLPQLLRRAKRLNVTHENIIALTSNSFEDIVQYVESTEPDKKPCCIILDSIQTFTLQSIEGLAGNTTQVKAVAASSIEFCKQHNITLFIIGHVTKDGVIAGPKVLEHLVDTVLSFEGDNNRLFRILRTLKNRFGSTQEVVVFQMHEKGLTLVENPATYFLEDRDATLSGTAIAMVLEGKLPLAVEVQALVTKTHLTIPRRVALGYDANRLTLLLAVLEKRLRCNFGEFDIHTKIGGGIRLQDPAIDLAIAVAVLSSLYNIPLPERSIVWGEVDLNGQIRPVLHHSLRYEQAKKLGYTPIIAPKHNGVGFSSITELGFLFQQ